MADRALPNMSRCTSSSGRLTARRHRGRAGLLGQAAEPTSTDSADALAGLLRRDPGALIVAEVDGRIVGSVIAGWDGWRGVHLPLGGGADHRRHGLGQSLLRAAEDHLAELGARRLHAIVVGANANARGLLGGTTGSTGRAAPLRQGVTPLSGRRSAASGVRRRLPAAAARCAARATTTPGRATRSAGRAARASARGRSRPRRRCRRRCRRRRGAADGAHRVERSAGRRPSRPARGRGAPAPPRARVRRKASPRTSAGDQARVNDAERGQRGPRRAAARDVGGHADGVAHEAAEAAGQDGDGRRQRGQREHGRRASTQGPHRQRPAGDVDRGQRVPVPPGQRRGRRPVEGPAGQERPQRGRALVR